MKQFKKLAIAAAIAGASVCGTSAQAAPVSVTTCTNVSGADATFSCIQTGSSAGGLVYIDGTIPSTGQGDAYDDAGFLQVNGAAYTPLTADLTGTTYTGGAVTLSGFNTRMQYFVDPTSRIIRNLATFTNTSGGALANTATWQVNSGADGGTVVAGSSSGDTTFSLIDRWVITDDSSVGGDPTNTTALYGTGPVLAPTTVFNTTTFSAAGNEGVRADFRLTLAAGESISLMFFSEMSRNQPEAFTGASRYDSLAPGNSVLAGLTPGDLDLIANWDFGGIAAVPEPAVVALLGIGLLGLGYSRRKRV